MSYNHVGTARPIAIVAKLTLGLVCWLMGIAAVAVADKLPVYVGTYTGNASEGIYRLQFDTETGAITDVELAAKVDNPSFLAMHPNGKQLYAVNESTDVHGPDMGGVSAFRIDPTTGMLTLLNQKPAAGTLPCHINVDDSGHTLLLANYGSGSAVTFAIGQDGSLGKQVTFNQHEGSGLTKRQATPHAHSVNLDAANRFAVVADLGTDELWVYAFDADTGALKLHRKTQMAAGSGPRHFSFHPNGRFAYAINEINSTVTALRYDADRGALAPIHSLSTVPSDYSGPLSTAEVRVSPDGRFVYGSNRGHDSIAVYRTANDGRLTLVEIEPIGGKSPRNFELDPTGRFLLAAGQGTNNINVFRIDQATGALERTEHTAEVPTPVCIRFYLGQQ